MLDPLKDCYNYTNINKPLSRQKVVDLISKLELVDIYRYLYSNQKQYMWRKKNPIKQARLDYFLVAVSMTDIIDKCSLNPGYRSDHSILKLQISINTFKQGKVLLIFNNSLLKDGNYLELVNNLIQEEKINYALPIYDLDFLKANDSIKMSIDSDQFLEILFLRILGETIKFTTNTKSNLILKKIGY